MNYRHELDFEELNPSALYERDEWYDELQEDYLKASELLAELKGQKQTIK